jgi:FkbM family methyltransferase
VSYAEVSEKVEKLMLKVDADLQRELEFLLAETAEEAQKRESSAFDKAVGPGSELVLFGAGNLGRRTLAGLRKIGIEPRCFVDNNSSRWGQSLDGLPLIGPEEAARLYGSRATFVVVIWGALAKDRMSHRIEQLRQLGCRSVVTFMPLYWKFPDLFLPHYTIDLPHRIHLDSDRIRKAFNLMADDRSRSEFVAQLKFRAQGDFAALPSPVEGPIYFRDELFQLGKRETLVDCGAFDGDTLNLFLEITANSFDRIIAFEPDPDNFIKLSGFVNSLPIQIRERIMLHQAATGAVHERVRMEVGSGPASHLGSGECEVECLTLDSVLREVPATFIKMDIEGSELSTLAGARDTIRRDNPILAISAYHRQSDLWNIPLLIHELNPGYSFYLRPHMLEAWDLVCYAVPGNRRA